MKLIIRFYEYLNFFLKTKKGSIATFYNLWQKDFFKLINQYFFM